MTALGVDHPALRARFGRRRVLYFEPGDPRWADTGSLASLPRTGWLIEGFPAQRGPRWSSTREAESVYEHSLKVRDIAVHLAKRRGLDVRKTERMALAHDLPEALTGDFVPRDAICSGHHPHLFAPSNKRELEHAALRRLDAECAGTLTTSGLMAVLEEYEARQSSEAKLVKAVDNLDFAVQSMVYAKADPRRLGFMSRLVDAARGRIKDPQLVRLLNRVEAGARQHRDVHALFLRLLVTGD